MQIPFFNDSGNHASFYCGVYYSLKASSQTEEVKHVFLSIQHLKIKSCEANTPTQSKSSSKVVHFLRECDITDPLPKKNKCFEVTLNRVLLRKVASARVIIFGHVLALS